MSTSELPAPDSKTDHRWIPLESNPDVFNAWAEKAGLVTSQACFHDVYGLDDELLQLLPQPIKAVILLFPIDDKINAQQEAEDGVLAEAVQPQLDTTVLWIKQTISNACGTIALLHALANTDVTITPGSALSEFIQQCIGKTPLERAQLLQTTPLFTNIHAELAEGGQSAVPTDLETDLHFTCFVQAPSEVKKELAAAGLDPTESGKEIKSAGGSSRIIELDGRREGPVDRGAITSHGFLNDVAKFIKDKYFKSNDTVLFSLMALAPPAED